MSLASYGKNRPKFIEAMIAQCEPLRQDKVAEIRSWTKTVLGWEKDDPYFMYFNWLELSLTQKLFGNLVKWRGFPQQIYESELLETFSIREEELKKHTSELLNCLLNKNIITYDGGEMRNIFAIPIITKDFQGAFGIMEKSPVRISFYDEETKVKALQALKRRFTDNMLWLYNSGDIRDEFRSKNVLTYGKTVIPENPNDRLKDKAESEIDTTLKIFAKSVFSELTSDIVLSAYSSAPGDSVDDYTARAADAIHCFFGNYRGILQVWYAIEKRKFSKKVQSELKKIFQVEDKLEDFLRKCDKAYSGWKKTGLDWVARAENK